jgi:inositol-hexakisphosphate/diphosphoinositol-pentakisphosphate 1-kinase
LKEVKLKKPRELQKILQIAQENISIMLDGARADLGLEEEKVKLEKYVQIEYILKKDRFEGLNRKVQLKPLKWETDAKGVLKITEALFVLKFGGELTHSGLNQAIKFGETFR